MLLRYAALLLVVREAVAVLTAVLRDEAIELVPNLDGELYRVDTNAEPPLRR